MNRKLNKTDMKTNKILSLFILPLCVGSAWAQEGEADSPKYDMEARKRSIVNLEQHIGERQERLTQIAQDIVTIDNRIEERVDKIVAQLKNVSDSNETKTSVSASKRKVIAGLRKAIEFYDSKRRRLKEEIAKAQPAVSPDVLASDVKVFDEKIEKRVSQIMDLANSMATNEDYEKYILVQGRRSGGWRKESYRKNPDYVQNRKETARSGEERRDLAKAVEESISNLDRRRRDLETRVTAQGLSEDQKGLIMEERAMTADLIERRKTQLAQLESPSAPNTVPVDEEGVYHIELLLEDAASDLGEDFERMFGRYRELNQERAQIKKLSDNLAARKAWMEKHDK